MRRGSIAAVRGAPQPPGPQPVVGKEERGERPLRLGDLGVRHLREILALQHLARGDGEPGVDLDLRLLLVAAGFRAERFAHARLRGARLLFSALTGATGDSNASIFSINPRSRQNSSNAS